jgi:pimeloyl-ACP methyl ester carboxylesterase
MAIFVVAHGAWSAGWAWKKMHPLLRGRGHVLWTPSYTGLGERAHLAGPDVTLDTHITDVVAMLEVEDLSNVILIGHSYGGMVATGVADRARDRVAKLVYLDAFAPRDGESVLDILPDTTREQRKTAATDNSKGARIPPGPMPADTSEADRVWCTPRRVPHPMKAFEQKIRLNAEPAMPRYYIYCTKTPPDDRFRRFYDRARTEGWDSFTIDASHNPHITTPNELADILEKIAK